MLSSCNLIGFLVTKDYDKARAFFEAQLGFQFIGLDQYALAMQAGAHMVKIEGGGWTVPIVRFLVERGIPVCAHLGFTPQSVHALGGYRIQGRGEAAAAELRTWQDSFVPGLFQLPAYVRALRLASAPDASAENLDRSVGLRSARQERLTGDNSLHFHAIVGEGVLRRCVGGVEVMRAQLNHMRDMAERLDHVTLQVVPFTVGAHPATSSFSLLRFPDESMSTAYVEFDRGAVYPERKPDVDYYTELFRRLSTEFALDRAASIEMIARAGDDLEKGAGS